MATLADALGKAKADTLYTAKPATLEAVTIVRATSPTWNDTAKQFTVPTTANVDYYEWRDIYGFALLTPGATVTRYSGPTSTTRILAKPKTGYGLAGSSFFLHTYPA